MSAPHSLLATTTGSRDQERLSSSSVRRSRRTGDSSPLPPPTRHAAVRDPPVASRVASPPDQAFLQLERRARTVLECVAMREADVEYHMLEYLETLRGYRDACQARAMYYEADLVQQVLKHLRLEEETRHVRGLSEQQMEQRRQLEEAHRAQFRAFHLTWNGRIDYFEEQQLEQEMALLERQNDEIIAFHEAMREYSPRVIRYSRRLIHARARQAALAKQRHYSQAEQAKLKADMMEMSDMKHFEDARVLMYERRKRALQHRHQQELLALRMRVDSRRIFLERGRKRELDELLQRYINLRRELETQQNIVRSKTGHLLLNHACNRNTDFSGSAALTESAKSGVYGSITRRIRDGEGSAASVEAAHVKPTSAADNVRNSSS